MSDADSVGYEAIVIGASAGGLNAISRVIADFDEHFSLPVFIAKHIAAGDKGCAAELLNKETVLFVVEAMDKQPIELGKVYLAPANYHMLIENKKLVSLGCDEKVCYVRPSVDVLFQSAATVFSNKLIAVILTGANADGAEGIRAVKKHGGLTIVQSPESAEVPVMPGAAIKTQCVDRVLSLEDIGHFINNLIVNNR